MSSPCETRRKPPFSAEAVACDVTASVRRLALWKRFHRQATVVLFFDLCCELQDQQYSLHLAVASNMPLQMPPTFLDDRLSAPHPDRSATSSRNPRSMSANESVEVWASEDSPHGPRQHVKLPSSCAKHNQSGACLGCMLCRLEH